MKAFASDNYAGVDPDLLTALLEANQEHEPAYGGDSYTKKAVEVLKKTFGDDATVYFVYNGTAANVLSLQSVTKSYNAIICTDSSHVVTQEVGAAAKLIGCAFLTVTHQQGKITPEGIENAYSKGSSFGRHANKPSIVSIAQTTEYGTVYTIEELKAISAMCKKYNLLLQMDGARLSNAVVALNTSLKAATADVGVDILNFGATKNGAMFGEAIIFFNPKLAEGFEYIQKQSLQLNSKGRFLSAPFIPYIEKNIWHRNAAHANAMCKKLAEALSKNRDIKIIYPVESNQIFAIFPKEIIEKTQKVFPYLVWDSKINLVRLITSFDTKPEEVEQFSALLSS
jgi:threonine aldolase